MRKFVPLLFLLASSVSLADPIFSLTPETEFALDDHQRQLHSWERGAGRYGGDALKVSSASETDEVHLSVFSEPQPLLLPDRLRMEAWLQSGGGEIHVDLIL